MVERKSVGKRIYQEAVEESLIVVWEAADRICGKRLKALMPTLVEAMEARFRGGPKEYYGTSKGQ